MNRRKQNSERLQYPKIGGKYTVRKRNPGKNYKSSLGLPCKINIQKLVYKTITIVFTNIILLYL